MEKKIFVFDLDDTLIDTDYKFELTFCDCIKTILLSFETRAPQIDEVLDAARALDNHKLATYPVETRYQPQRLYDTWLETYALLCEKHGLKPKAHVKQQLKGLIGQNFDAPWYIIPGAEETLEKLKDLPDVELHVLTVGDVQVQQRKLQSTQLIRFFKHVQVTTADKQAYLEQLAKKFGAGNVTMVGNSLKSDINPALRAGVNVVHIPRGNWHHAYEEPETEFTTVRDIRDLVKLLGSCG